MTDAYLNAILFTLHLILGALVYIAFMITGLYLKK